MNRYVVLVVCLISLHCTGQGLLETANKKYGEKDWKGASNDYQKYLKKNKSDSAAWFNLAMSQKNLEEYDAAIKSFDKARETNFSAFPVDLNQAKAYVLSGKTDQMYIVMEASVGKGFPAFLRLQRDQEFAALQDQKRFKDLVAKAEINAYPCLGSEDSRHFDFWIGEWDVYFNGQKVGENSITRATGGCAIHESYTTQGAYAGQSINFYSPVDKKWHQHWVGSAGDVYNYVETKRDKGYLQFESDYISPQGVLTRSRLTFTLNDDDTVDQVFENSTDEGKTWSKGFVGHYERKK